MRRQRRPRFRPRTGVRPDVAFQVGAGAAHAIAIATLSDACAAVEFGSFVDVDPGSAVFRAKETRRTRSCRAGLLRAFRPVSVPGIDSFESRRLGATGEGFGIGAKEVTILFEHRCFDHTAYVGHPALQFHVST